MIEEKANRYFFIHDPVGIKILNSPKKIVQLDLHPDFPDRGQRTLTVHDEINIAEDDYEELIEGKLYRLMDYCNFEVVDKKFKFVSEDYEEFKNAKNRGMIIHWLPVEDNVVVEVVMEDNTHALGLGEKSMLDLKEGDIVQLERFSFCRLDKKESNKLTFWYLHK